MKLVVVIAAISWCGNKSDAPRLKLDSGAVTETRSDAAVADAPAAAAKPTPQKLAVGDKASCALMSDATLRCWDATAVTDMKLRGVQDVVASQGFACARLDDGSVTCWGDIGFGEHAKAPQPTGVPGVTKAQRLFAIGGAACMQTADGALACWGDVDTRGHVTQTGAHRSPTAVVGVDHVVALAERAALREDGDVVYWGDGAPKKLAIKDGKEIASAGELACVRRADDHLWCIAGHALCAKSAKPPAPAPAPKAAKAPKGKTGKTGKAGKAGRPPPPPPPPPPEPAKLALEELPLGKIVHVALVDAPCAITAAHKLVCADPTDACKPGGVTKALAAVDAISGHCAQSPRGTVTCWASDGKPVAIAGIADVVELAATADRGCALTKDHRVWCWTGTGAATAIEP